METLTINNKPKQKIKTDLSLIFLVDDHPIFLKILKSDLGNLPNTEIMTFTSGEECLKQMHLNPSLVVLDYDLRGDNPKLMNGVEVLRDIKKQHPETEVIMLSGWDDIAVATTSMKFGAFDYVVKNENALLNVRNKINNIFRKYKILEQLKVAKSVKWIMFSVLVVLSLFAAFSNRIMGSF